MERLNKFVSSRGILQSARCRNRNPRSSSPHLDLDLLSGHQDGGSIYVCTDALDFFSKEVMQKVSGKFVLVSGDSDSPIDCEFVENGPGKHILANPNLIIWYAQNLCVTGSKLVQLPIGLDYHTMSERNTSWGMLRQSPVSQETALLEVIQRAKNIPERLGLGYCNFHFSIERGDRRECLKSIDNSLIFLEPHPLPRIATWRRQSECMFVISPEGMGMDCHRTWEALVLGCIPVVKRSAFTGIFSDLPVLILDDWGDFNKRYLESKLGYFLNATFDYSPVFLPYWAERIGYGESKPLPKMKMGQFREFLVGSSY